MIPLLVAVLLVVEVARPVYANEGFDVAGFNRDRNKAVVIAVVTLPVTIPLTIALSPVWVPWCAYKTSQYKERVKNERWAAFLREWQEPQWSLDDRLNMIPYFYGTTMRITDERIPWCDPSKMY